MENTEMLMMMINEKNPSFDDWVHTSYEDLFDDLEDLPMVVFDANGQLLPQSNSYIDHHRCRNSWADIFWQTTTLPTSDHTISPPSGSLSELMTTVDDTKTVSSSSSSSVALRKVSEIRPAKKRYFSKKKGSSGTSTKFIKADRNNFKDVVQRYTGCHRIALAKTRSSTAMGGPVMLRFDQVTHHQLAGSTVAAPVANLI